MCGDDGPVRSEVQRVVELAVEVLERGVGLGQGLEDGLAPRGPVLREQDLAEPSFADDLQDVKLFRQVHLHRTKGS